MPAPCLEDWLEIAEDLRHRWDCVARWLGTMSWSRPQTTPAPCVIITRGPIPSSCWLWWMQSMYSGLSTSVGMAGPLTVARCTTLSLVRASEMAPWTSPKTPSSRGRSHVDVCRLCSLEIRHFPYGGAWCGLFLVNTGGERWLSQARIVVELAFAILSLQWRMYRRVMSVKAITVETCVRVTCILHNYLWVMTLRRSTSAG